MVVSESTYILVRFLREFGGGRIVSRDEVGGFVEKHRIQVKSCNMVEVAFT